MKKIAVCIAAHDGLISLYSGVGIVVHSFLEAFKDIKERGKLFNGANLELICAALYLNEESKDYRSDIRSRTRSICEENGGKIIIVPSLSNGKDVSSVWGGAHQWKSASFGLASYIASIYSDYDEIYLFAHDTIFSLIRKYAPNLVRLNVVWIPHSLGAVFRDEFSGDERIVLEKQAIAALQKTSHDVIGYIGDATRKVLTEEYGVPDDKLVPFVNGVYEKSARFSISNEDVEQKIKQYKIPLDKKLILAWGRCVPQKGYDVLIPAYGRFLQDQQGYHLILLMPTETTPQEYLDKIKKQIADLPTESVTTVYEFDNALPYCVLKNENLKMIVFPSRFEGAPITSLEALLLARKDVRFIYTTIPPLVDTFRGDDRGMPLSNLTVDSLYNAMRLATELKKVTKTNISPSFVENYVTGLNILLEETK